MTFEIYPTHSLNCRYAFIYTHLYELLSNDSRAKWHHVSVWGALSRHTRSRHTNVNGEMTWGFNRKVSLLITDSVYYHLAFIWLSRIWTIKLKVCQGGVYKNNQSIDTVESADTIMFEQTILHYFRTILIIFSSCTSLKRKKNWTKHIKHVLTFIRCRIYF